METVVVNGEIRNELGKKATKEVRNSGKIPCVLYGSNDNLHFTTTLNDLRPIVYTPDFKTAEVSVNGDTRKCILKEIKFHPVTDDIVHVDFLELIKGRKVRVEVPIRFTGASPGVRSGGKLQQNVRRIKIKTTPEHLVSDLAVDISKLEMGQSIRVRDIEVPDGVEIMVSPGIPIATIEIPRAMRSATAAAEKAEGGNAG